MRESLGFDCWVDDYRKMFEQCGRKFGTCMDTGLSCWDLNWRM